MASYQLLANNFGTFSIYEQLKCITINYYYAFEVRVKVILGLLIYQESATILVPNSCTRSLNAIFNHDNCKLHMYCTGKCNTPHNPMLKLFFLTLRDMLHNTFHRTKKQICTNFATRCIYGNGRDCMKFANVFQIQKPNYG